MKMVGLVSLILMLSACASAQSTYLPDGSRGYNLDCSGTARNWGMCQEKAGELCGAKGYEVVSATGDNGAVMTATQYSMVAGTTISRTMLVKCK